jgi:hypothetical protein
MTNMHGVRGHNSRNASKPEGKLKSKPEGKLKSKPEGKTAESTPPTKAKGGAKGRTAS